MLQMRTSALKEQGEKLQRPMACKQTRSIQVHRLRSSSCEPGQRCFLPRQASDLAAGGHGEQPGRPLSACSAGLSAGRSRPRNHVGSWADLLSRAVWASDNEHWPPRSLSPRRWRCDLDPGVKRPTSPPVASQVGRWMGGRDDEWRPACLLPPLLALFYSVCVVLVELWCGINHSRLSVPSWTVFDPLCLSGVVGGCFAFTPVISFWKDQH